jgi:hypothetical protein
LHVPARVFVEGFEEEEDFVLLLGVGEAFGCCG